MADRNTNELDDRLDQEFVTILKKIQNKYSIFNRHLQIRIEKWVQKLLQYDQNTVWRKSRNNYISRLCQMVMRGKIEGIFTKMPPQKDIPNLTETELRKVTHGNKINNKPEIIHVQEVIIKKIDSPNGDTGSALSTPSCQTDRNLEVQKQQQHQQQIKNQVKSQCKQQIGNDQRNILEKVARVLSKKHDKFNQNSEYMEIMGYIEPLLQQAAFGTLDDQSTQLKVEEGIEIGKANLFQFGSPRGMTQMQYFRAALQL